MRRSNFSNAPCRAPVREAGARNRCSTVKCANLPPCPSAAFGSHNRYPYLPDAGVAHANGCEGLTEMFALAIASEK